MSVGGKVVETIVLDEKVWVNTKDGPYKSTTAIYVERTAESRSISEGDTVWWQGQWAFWTPANGPFEDRKLKRIGFSGVKRPEVEK
jgi:hypothetical protein